MENLGSTCSLRGALVPTLGGEGFSGEAQPRPALVQAEELGAHAGLRAVREGLL